MQKIHIHGTGIDIIGNDLPNDLGALAAGDGGTIHANQSSFFMEPRSTLSKKIRILTSGTGHIHAPYAWEPHTIPPNINSVTGADTAVVTDGVQPHLIIYSENCTSKWFDTSTNACRP